MLLLGWLVACTSAKDAADPGDTGTVDTGPADTGADDTGSADTGPDDTGPTDTGPTDTGPTDAGPTDTGPTDTGPGDDTGSVDTGATWPFDEGTWAATFTELLEDTCGQPDGFIDELNGYGIAWVFTYGSWPAFTADDATCELDGSDFTCVADGEDGDGTVTLTATFDSRTTASGSVASWSDARGCGYTAALTLAI